MLFQLIEVKKKITAERDKLVASLFLRITCITWLITKIITWRMWTTSRLFPLAPHFEFLVAPAAVHGLLFAVSVLLMLDLIFFNPTKKVLLCLLLAEVAACLFDQARWQPWEYQFIFTLFIYIVSSHQVSKILAGTGFLMVSTYFYSGVGKFNPGFLYLFWDGMLLKSFFKLPDAVTHQSIVYYGGYVLGVIELIFGLGLLFFKTQKFCAWMLIAMHIFIMVVVGPLPFGLHYNFSVWPWNVLMIIQLYLVFIYEASAAIAVKELWQGWAKIVLIAWGFLPMLNHTLGWWDNFLSSRLFAGVHPQLVLCIQDSAELKELKPYLYKKDPLNLCAGKAYVNIQAWSMKEIKSPSYIEERVCRIIRKKWMESHPGSSTKGIIYYYTGLGKIRIAGD